MEIIISEISQEQQDKILSILSDEIMTSMDKDISFEDCETVANLLFEKLGSRIERESMALVIMTLFCKAFKKGLIVMESYLRPLDLDEDIVESTEVTLDFYENFDCFSVDAKFPKNEYKVSGHLLRIVPA